MPRIYMDANATTPLAPEVLAAMRPWFEGGFGNASSIHQFGQQARAAVEQARRNVAALLNSRPSEIVFTSGGTESDNLALFGVLRPGDHLITSAIEHHAVLHAAEVLAGRGIEVTFLPPDASGAVDPAEVKRALRANTRLISIMMANNETGVLQPVEEIGRIAAEAGALLHTDAVQAAGKISIDVEALGCQLLTISGHKMHGPQGVGALYIRRRTRIEPLFHGGAHERQRRAGTENVAGIVGLGAAAELARATLLSGEAERMTRLRDRLESGLLEQVEGASVNGGGRPRVPNTSNIRFSGADGEALVIALDLKGLAVSTGAACSSGALEPSHVLLAMGLPAEEAKASLRFSLIKSAGDADIEYALKVVPAAVARMRELSAVHPQT